VRSEKKTSEERGRVGAAATGAMETLRGGNAVEWRLATASFFLPGDNEFFLLATAS
jgi:hypothetical protein